MRRICGLLLLTMTIIGTSWVLAQPPEDKKDKKGEKGPKGDKGGRSPADPAALTSRLMAYDSNKDRKLTKLELGDPRLDALFDRANVNKDDHVTADELTALFTKVSAAMSSGGGKEKKK